MNCQFLALLNPHVDRGGFSLYFQYKRAGSLPPGGIITSEDLIPEMIVTHDGSQFSATIRDQGEGTGEITFLRGFRDDLKNTTPLQSVRTEQQSRVLFRWTGDHNSRIVPHAWIGFNGGGVTNFVQITIAHLRDARGGIRTHGPLRDRILSPAPLARLSYPRSKDPVPIVNRRY
jgi:hypothetical protein